MLKNKLYTVSNLTHQEYAINAVLQINKGHEIFEGHFPGQPVLPGACMLQLMKEVFEIALKQRIVLRKANMIKFLTLVDPTVNDTLQLSIVYRVIDSISFEVTANLKQQDVCFKFKGDFILF